MVTPTPKFSNANKFRNNTHGIINKENAETLKSVSSFKESLLPKNKLNPQGPVTYASG
jgi:hypothetical protein